MKCIQCSKKIGKNRRKFCSDKCKWKLYGIQRYKLHRLDIIKRNSKYYHKNKNKVLPQQIKYKMQRYKQDSKFHKLDNIRKIATHNIPLDNKKCANCKTKNDLQRHHPDYTKPKQVIILCRKCHNNLHEKEKYHAH